MSSNISPDGVGVRDRRQPPASHVLERAPPPPGNPGTVAVAGTDPTHPIRKVRAGAVGDGAVHVRAIEGAIGSGALASAGLRIHGALLVWLNMEMARLAPLGGKPGRSPVFSNAAIRFGRAIKILFKLPLQQTAGGMVSLLRLSGLD